MTIYNRKQWWKFVLISIAILIGVSSLYYTGKLVKKLSFEEREKMKLWSEATRQLGESDISEKNFGFLLQVVQNNRTVPVILTDSAEKILSYRNIDSIKALNSNYLREQLIKMKKAN